MSSPDPRDNDWQTPPVEVIDPAESASDASDPLVPQLQQFWLQFQGWFNGLPVLAKGAVAIALMSVSLSLLTKVLHFVASVISVAILGIILYVLYRIFIKSQPSA